MSRFDLKEAPASNADNYDEQMDILQINQLDYSTPLSVNVAAERSRSVSYFNPQSYPSYNSSDVMTLIFNTSGAYIDAMNSTLNFSIKVSTTSGDSTCYFWSFGDSITGGYNSENYYNTGGSALNLFNQVSVQSKSGEQLVLIQQFNQYIASHLLFSKNSDYRKYMSMMGGAVEGAQQFSGLGNTPQFPLFPVNQFIEFACPLSLLTGGLTASAKLLPPHLLAGARLLLTLANPAEAICFWGTAAAGPPARVATPNDLQMSLDNARILMDMSYLIDSCNALINSAAASLSSSGIQYAYRSVYSQLSNVTGTSAQILINVTAAKLEQMLVKIVNLDGRNFPAVMPMATTSINQNFDGAENTVGRLGTSGAIQTRVGASFLSLYQINSVADLYSQSCRSAQIHGRESGCDDVNELHNKNELFNAVLSYDEYAWTAIADDNTTSANLGTGCSAFIIDLQKSSAVGLSGVSSNNARQLVLSIAGLRSGNYAIYTYCTYVALANCTTENIIVDR